MPREDGSSGVTDGGRRRGRCGGGPHLTARAFSGKQAAQSAGESADGGGGGRGLREEEQERSVGFLTSVLEGMTSQDRGASGPRFWENAVSPTLQPGFALPGRAKRSELPLLHL